MFSSMQSILFSFIWCNQPVYLFYPCNKQLWKIHNGNEHWDPDYGLWVLPGTWFVWHTSDSFLPWKAEFCVRTDQTNKITRVSFFFPLQDLLFLGHMENESRTHYFMFSYNRPGNYSLGLCSLSSSSRFCRGHFHLMAWDSGTLPDAIPPDWYQKIHKCVTDYTFCYP